MDHTSFYNHEHRSEYNIYLNNTEKYLGIRPETFASHFRLKVIQYAHDFVNDNPKSMGLTGGKKIEYKGHNISITSIS